MSAPAATLAGYSDETLADWYSASAEDSWREIILAEMKRRDDEAEAARRRSTRPDPLRAEWLDAAHAQYLAAERECKGVLVRGVSHDYREDPETPGACTDCGRASGHVTHSGVSPFALWSGSEAFAQRWASEELLGYWQAHPRVTVSGYRRQVQHQTEVYRDEMGRDEALRVQPDAAGITQQAQSRHRGDRAADAVPGPAAGDGTESERAGRGTARAGGAIRDGGSVSVGGFALHAAEAAVRDAAQVAARSQRDAARARLLAVTQRASGLPPDDVPAQSGVIVPAGLQRRSTALVAARQHVDGDLTLRYIYTFLRHFAHWDSEAELIAATLWVAATHARDDNGYPVGQYCARLAIVGKSGSGKSWKSRLIGKLSYSGEILVEPTAPAFIDLCAENHTVIMTEADEAFRSPGRSRKILAVANASYEPDRSSSRKQGGVAVRIRLFCHLVLDGIDDVLLSPNRPDLAAMMSRCIIVMSRRAPEGYRPPRFDGRARGTAEMISQRATAWMAQEVAAGMAEDVPSVPEHLGNRPFALWEQLFIVAGRADRALRDKARLAGEDDPGRPWSDACWDACEQLEQAVGVPDHTEDQASELDRQMAMYGLSEDDPL